MRFQMPQFIDIEDKIFGPLTLKQFIYLAGGAGAAGIAVVFFGTLTGLVIASPMVGLAVALAFYRPNNRPFVFYLQSMLQFAMSSKLFLWEKRERKTSEIESVQSSSSTLAIPNIGENRLKDMNWNLDVKKEEGVSNEKF